MMSTYTAFCRDKNNTGTTWIQQVEANGIEDACETAEILCADAWGWDPKDVKCIGLATGDITIEYWDDIE